MEMVNTLTTKLTLSLDEIQKILLEKGFITKNQTVTEAYFSKVTNQLSVDCISVEEKKIKIDNNQPQELETNNEELRKILDTRLEDLDISSRLYNALERASIKSLRDIVYLSEDFIMSLRNVGTMTMNELKVLLKQNNLEFGQLIQD